MRSDEKTFCIESSHVREIPSKTKKGPVTQKGSPSEQKKMQRQTNQLNCVYGGSHSLFQAKERLS